MKFETFYGQVIDFEDMESVNRLDLCDILIMMDMVKRFNGRGISVLSHAMALANYFEGDPDNQARAVLHDMAEAFIGDIITPIKQAIQFTSGNIEVAILNKLSMLFINKPYAFINDINFSRIDKAFAFVERQTFVAKYTDEVQAHWEAVTPKIVKTIAAENKEVIEAAMERAITENRNSTYSQLTRKVQSIFNKVKQGA